jgi:hypothetical protein
MRGMFPIVRNIGGFDPYGFRTRSAIKHMSLLHSIF